MMDGLLFCKQVNTSGMNSLKVEMMQFKRIVADNPRSRAKFFYSGKAGGQDDTVMAISMGLWWAMQYTHGSL